MIKRKRKNYLQVNQGIQGGEGLVLDRPISGASGSSLDFKDNAGQNKRARLSGSTGTEKSPYFVKFPEAKKIEEKDMKHPPPWSA